MKTPEGDRYRAIGYDRAKTPTLIGFFASVAELQEYLAELDPSGKFEKVVVYDEYDQK